MNRERFMYERGRDVGLDRDFEMRNRGGGLLPGPPDDFDIERSRYGASGLLGESPRPAPRPLLPEATPPSLLGRAAPVPSSAPDPLTAGLQEQILKHKRLEEKLTLRESQLALASNLLQQQSQMLGDINTKMVGGHGGSGLMGPGPGAPPHIPSLLDAPGPRPLGHPGLPMKRPNEGMRMDMKRSRFDPGPPPVHPVERRHDLDRPGDRGMMRDEYDPEFPTPDRGFTRHMRSRQHEDRLRGVGEVARSNMARNKAQKHLRLIEDDDTFCKVCVEVMKIPADKHKKTTIHRKRVVQVNMGCRWCGVPSFKDFKEVLNHRATKTHMDNEKKMKATEGSNKSQSQRERDRDRKDRDRKRHDDDDVIVGDRKYSDRGRGKDKEKDKKSAASKKVSKDSKTNGTSKSSAKPTEKKTEPAPKPKDVEDFQAQVEATKKDLDELENSVFDSQKTVGSNLVIPVTGFFCKLCHKFYNNEEAAKVGHCKTQVHFDKYKATMLGKLKKKMEAEQMVLDNAIKEKAEREAKEKEEREAKEKLEAEVIEIKDDDENSAVQADSDGDYQLETPEDEINEETIDNGETEEGAEPSNPEDVTMVTDTDTQVVEDSVVLINDSTLEDAEEQNGEEDIDNQNNVSTEKGDETSDYAIVTLDESHEQTDQSEDQQIENEAEQATSESFDMENTENDEEGDTMASDETPEETQITKSPRGRMRTGKPRGGKAKRGKKTI